MIKILDRAKALMYRCRTAGKPDFGTTALKLEDMPEEGSRSEMEPITSETQGCVDES
jgi:hypothetical protein